MSQPLFDNSAASATVVKGGAGYARNTLGCPVIAVFGYYQEKMRIVQVPPIPPRSGIALQVPCFEGLASAAASAADQPRPH